MLVLWGDAVIRWLLAVGAVSIVGRVWFGGCPNVTEGWDLDPLEDLTS